MRKLGLLGLPNDALFVLPPDVNLADIDLGRINE